MYLKPLLLHLSQDTHEFCETAELVCRSFSTGVDLCANVLKKDQIITIRATTSASLTKNFAWTLGSCHTVLVSRLPKALFRVLRGYTDRESHHQIMTHRLLRKLCQVHPTSCGNSAASMSRWVWNPPAGEAAVPITNCERNEPVRLPRDLRIVTTDDYLSQKVAWAPREGRQGSRERPDRRVDPLSRRSHSFHPYWSQNLKYVS